MREVEIPYEGETVRAHELDFTTEIDNWSEYRTEECFRIKMRNVVARIYRLVDRTREDGTPIHVLHGSVVIDTTPPERQAEREGAAS